MKENNDVKKELTLSEKRERFFNVVDEPDETFKYKIYVALMVINIMHECEREQMVSYFQMAPLIQKSLNVTIKEADYILYGHPIARVEDFTEQALMDIEAIDMTRKENAEIIIMGKATNLKPYIDGKYKNITYVESHFAEYIGKRFGFDFKDEYFVYDDEHKQLNVWPVDGCLNKCAFCRRTFMHIPFESKPLEFIKLKLDWYKENHPEQMETLCLRAENIAEYGLDIYNKQMLHKVIDLVDSYDEVKKIKIFIGICIGEITEEILTSLCNTKKLTFAALNIEAGSDRLLKIINKKHTKEQAKYVFQKLYEANPNLYITSTVMIGLPTEELTDVIELGELINEISPNNVLCNFYGHSPKNNLEKYPQLDNNVKKYHLKVLMNVLKKGDRKRTLRFLYEAPFRKNKRIDARIKKEIEEQQEFYLPRVLNRNIMYYKQNGDRIHINHYKEEFAFKKREEKTKHYTKKF